MSGLARRTPAAEQPVRRRTDGPRFGELGTRLANGLSRFDSTRSSWDAWEETAPAMDIDPPRDADPALPNFPISRQGYECDAVDNYVADIEAELAERDRDLASLRARAPAKS